MNTISISQLEPNKFFSEDSFIFEDLFFIPKNLPVMSYHINLLKTWNIDKVYTNGILLDAQIANSKEGNQENEESHLEDLFDTPENLVDVHEEAEEPVLPSINDSPNDFKSIYKKWIVMTVGFHNSIISTKNVDKEKVAALLGEIKDTVRKNKNEALKMFGRRIEGIPYIHRKTIETTILSLILADSMGITEFASTNLMFATLYHDLGMV